MDSAWLDETQLLQRHTAPLVVFVTLVFHILYCIHRAALIGDIKHSESFLYEKEHAVLQFVLFYLCYERRSLTFYFTLTEIPCQADE